MNKQNYMVIIKVIKVEDSSVLEKMIWEFKKNTKKI